MRGKSNNPNLLDAFLEHKNTLAAYIAQRVIRSEDVEDILQESFIELQVANDREVVRSPKSYLFVIARNILSKQLVRHAKFRLTQLDEADVCNHHSGAAEPDNQLHNKLQLSAFSAAVNSLPPHCKRVFLLRKIKSLSHNEIVEELGISKSTVERHITLAMSRISSEMLRQGYDRPTRTHAVSDINVDRSSKFR